jgi:DNA-binding XRE family transcriptional regulator
MIKKNNNPVDLDDLFQEEMMNPAFRKEWEENEADFELGKLMIENRKKKRLSQRALAKNIGTTQAVISRIENNSVSPTFQMAARIARGLGKRLQIRFV